MVEILTFLVAALLVTVTIMGWKLRSVLRVLQIKKVEGGMEMRLGFKEEVALFIKQFDDPDKEDDIIMVCGR